MRRVVSALLLALGLFAGNASAQPPIHAPVAAPRVVEPAEPRAMRSSGPTTPTKLHGPLFADDRPRPTDPVQGEAGDCFFISAMSAVAQRRPELLKNAVTPQPDGSYKVRLYEPKKDSLGRERLVPVDVVVDKEVPSHDGKPAYATGHQGNWPAIVEKAFASLKGSYSKIGNGGFGKDALEALTGKRATDIWFEPKETPKVVAQVEEAVKDGRPVLAATRTPKDLISVIADAKKSGLNADARDKLVLTANPEGGQRLVDAMAKYGMVPGHQYTIFGVGERDGKKLIVLRNPWGSLSPAAKGIGEGPVREEGRGVFALPAEEFGFLFDSVVVGAGDPAPKAH